MSLLGTFSFLFDQEFRMDVDLVRDLAFHHRGNRNRKIIGVDAKVGGDFDAGVGLADFGRHHDVFAFSVQFEFAFDRVIFRGA